MSGNRKLKTSYSKQFKNKKQLKVFEDKLSEELYEVVEALTHSGQKKLCPEEFDKVKNICKQSDKYVNEIYELVIKYLQEKHAEVRLSAFQICDEIFRRSNSFREQVISNLEEVVELTTGKDLPPPLSVARDLKRYALKTIHTWNDKFKDKHKKLNICYNYLRDVKKVDFTSLEIVDTATQARLEENRRRLENINKQRIKKVLDEVKEKEADIQAAAVSLSNCINLLLPHPDDFFIADADDTEPVLPTAQSGLTTAQHQAADDSEDEGGSQDACLREVGLLGYNHSIQVDFTPSSETCIEETTENKDIIENTKEFARLVKNKYLPSVKAWLEVLSKSTTYAEDHQRLVGLRGELEDLVFKYEQLTFTCADDVSSDSDLEEVPSLPEPKPPERQELQDPTLWSISSQHTVTGDPTSATPPVAIKKEPIEKSTPEDMESQPSASEASSSSQEQSVSERKRKLLAVAPKLPFDIDLYHWEDEKLPVPTMISSSTEGHRFWLGAESCMDELPVPEGSAALRTRVIEFSGSFRPVQHSCRVRLPSGKLCPRRDRVKCPFHGEIVPRDERGECVKPEDAMRLQALAEKRQQERPDWQNPRLLADIKRTTGIDLKMPEKGKRKKKKKEFPGLTDLKASENTSTSRLEKKIFKKSVMRKVASAMDRLDRRKFNDKFSDQFQYFYTT